MARVTSSRNRSKRSTKKPVSTDKGRQARARVSQARVTSASNGKASGSASSRVTQGRGGASKPAGRPALPPAKAPRAALPPAKPAAKPNGRQPRAITNGSSLTMRRIRAKAVQARRQAQGKSTVASRNPGITPDSARGQRIRQMANSQRVIGDGGRVRAAAAQGARNVAQAQARRNAKAASQRMTAKLRQAAAKRTAAGGLKGGVKAAVFMEGLTSRNTADGTLTAAKQRGDLAKRRKPSPQESATYRSQEAKARAKNASRRSSSFDDAFASARRAKVKTFTWRGKKYTTEMK
jgi:hypothetical protein